MVSAAQAPPSVSLVGVGNGHEWASVTGRQGLAALICLLVVGGLVAGVFTGALPWAARQGLTAAGLSAPAPAETSTPTATHHPRATGSPASIGPTVAPEPAAELPADVLSPATPAPGAQASQVAARIAGVSVKGFDGSLSAEVVDVGSGKALYRSGADRPLTPASTMKLLTSASALRLLGPEHRFRTTVVQPTRGTVVLVGGGDPYLTASASGGYPVKASVADLAAQTAATLRRQKRTSVSVGYDATLFSGPAWNPIWPAGYADQVTPTSALWVDEGRLRGGSPGPRTDDPAGDAADAFVAALRRQKIKVTKVTAEQAPGGAATIASVSSMPLERIVEQLLMSSDNDAAEVLFRQAGLAAEKGGSVSGGRKAVKAELTELGVWDDGTEVHDGSGLARQTGVPADTMVELLQAAAGTKHPELRALITGLPVAGVEGSLRHRFSSDDTQAARGLVRGKTGTLRKVHSLAGFVRTKDGTMLAYAFIVNDPSNDFAAVVWLEKVTAAIAACGCRG